MELNRIEKLVGGEGVSARIFADFCSVKMPVRNASVYLQRLYKMNLATRKKASDWDYSTTYRTKKPYMYKVSKQGHKYLLWLDSPKKWLMDKRKHERLIASLDCMSQEELEDFKLDLLLNKTHKIDTLEWIDLIARINEIKESKGWD
ncbi:MAG: hypothetical protein QXE05_12450 [Nitrososphaeria archaeon]